MIDGRLFRGAPGCLFEIRDLPDFGVLTRTGMDRHEGEIQEEDAETGMSPQLTTLVVDEKFRVEVFKRLEVEQEISFSSSTRHQTERLISILLSSPPQ